MLFNPDQGMQGYQPLLAGGWLPILSVVACWPGIAAVDAAAIRIATSYLFFSWQPRLVANFGSSRWCP